MAKILVAGGSLEDRSTLALMLEFGGHRCELSDRLREVADSLRKDSFDVVLLDCRQASSSTVPTKLLKVASPKTAVIVLGKRAEPKEREVDGIVLNPRSPQEPFASIQKILQRKPPGAIRHTTMATREACA